MRASHDDFAALSQELRQVEWIGEQSRGSAAPVGVFAHAADHWSFEFSLVVFGALAGVALYFGSAA